ncbi:MAG TPA: hypothetical protein VI894_02570 [Candidatus Nanoarchaeia archaeon]|nr:hypothetical protein [Candidatus Nanoarchaeia archaeon]
MKPSRFARQHHPRYHMFYCKALRSCNVFRPTSFAPLTSDILHKAVFRGWLIFVQATNRAAERSECCTTFGQAFCKRLVDKRDKA